VLEHGLITGTCPARALFAFLRAEYQSLAADSAHGGCPSFADKARALVGQVDASSLRVTPADAAQLRATNIPVGYMEVFSDPVLTVSIFLLGKGARVPLHDHPGMFVFGRALFGQARLVSYTPEEALPAEDSKASGLWASRHQDEVLGPEPMSFEVQPRTGNIHELFALEDFAFFDVTTPSYDNADDRPCTYYGASPDDPAGCRYKLTKVSPDGFLAQGIMYRGPRCRLGTSA